MPINVQSSGFVEIFVALINGIPTLNAQGVVNKNVTIVPFGIGARAPQTQSVPSYFGVKSDQSGQQLNFDEGFAGAECMTTIEVTKWDEAVLQALGSVFNLAGDGDLVWSTADVGTLMNTEGFGTEIWFRYGRRKVAAMKALGMPDGYHYYGARLVGFTPKAGNEQNAAQLSWHHRAFLNKTNGNFYLRDRDMAAVSGLDAIL
jgi:hypothetical protein